MKPIRTTGRILLVLLLTVCLGLTGCSSEKKIRKNFELSASEISLKTGQTQRLELKDLEEKDIGEYTVTWASSQPSVATVDEQGVVTAVAVGTATVTATVTAEKGEAEFPCAVTVTLNDTPLSSIAFNTNVYSLGSGQTLNLNDEVVFYPSDAGNKTLSWKSSNESIATVNNGIVTPVSQGVTTITATAADNSVSASCMIQVSKVAVDATKIEIEKSEYTISVGQTVLLNAIVTPEGATGYSILWQSSDPTVASMSGNAIIGIAEGEVIVTARLNTGNDILLAETTVIVENTEVEVPATKVVLSPASLKVSADDTALHSFVAQVSPANCTQAAIWTTNREDLIHLDSATGKFSLKGNASLTETTAVLITCTVGEVLSTGVVYIDPPEPKLLLNKETATIYDKAPHNELQLVAALTTSNELPDVNWRSSNSSVAVVDSEGNVTAISPGTCQIFATGASDRDLTAVCTVTVEKAPYLTVKVGETVDLDPTLLPTEPSEEESGWSYLKTHLEIDPTTLTVTGIRVSDTTPVVVTVLDKNGNVEEAKTFEVYVLPAE